MKQEQFEQKTQQALSEQEELEQRQQQARSQLTPKELAWQNDLEEIQLVIIIVLVASWGTYWYFSVHL
jgi:DsbC/DsbD-like thiol-disulfide interchange protein